MRRFLFILALLVALLPRPALAQAGPMVFALDGSLEAFDYEDLTVSNTAKAFTATKWAPAGAPAARAVVCTWETAQIRYRYDGTDPTAAEGTLAGNTDTFPTLVIGRNNIRKWRGIRTAGSDVTGRCTYLR